MFKSKAKAKAKGKGNSRRKGHSKNDEDAIKIGIFGIGDAFTSAVISHSSGSRGSVVGDGTIVSEESSKSAGSAHPELLTALAESIEENDAKVRRITLDHPGALRGIVDLPDLEGGGDMAPLSGGPAGRTIPISAVTVPRREKKVGESGNAANLAPSSSKRGKGNGDGGGNDNNNITARRRIIMKLNTLNEIMVPGTTGLDDKVTGRLRTAATTPSVFSNDDSSYNTNDRYFHHVGRDQKNFSDSLGYKSHPRAVGFGKVPYFFGEVFRRLSGGNVNMDYLDVEKNESEERMPLPKLPHQTSRGLRMRMLVALICFVVSIIISLYGGRGQFGQKTATYVYRTVIYEDAPIATQSVNVASRDNTRQWEDTNKYYEGVTMKNEGATGGNGDIGVGDDTGGATTNVEETEGKNSNERSFVSSQFQKTVEEDIPPLFSPLVEPDGTFVHGWIKDMVIEAVLPQAYRYVAPIDESWSHRRDKDLPLFWQVPKAGGTIIQNILSQCLDTVRASHIGRNNIGSALKIQRDSSGSMYVNVDTSTKSGILRAKELKLAESRFADVVFTPYPYDAASNLLDSSHRGRLFGIFRHPVNRTVAMYSYTKSQTRTTEDMTLLQYVRTAVNNPMMRTILGKSDDAFLNDNDLLVALRIIRERVLVGISERMSDSVRKFEMYFQNWEEKVVNDQQIEECQDIMTQSRPVKYPDLYEDDIDYQWMIYENRYDMQLYNFARRMFVEQLTGIL